MTEGVITQWFINEGESVSEGAELFEMETDKLTICIPAPVGGTLLKIIHGSGDTVPITEPIAIVGDKGEDISGLIEGFTEQGELEISVPQVAEEVNPESITTAPLTQKTTSGYASPRAKTSAEQRGIDYREVAGSGPDGFVIERDILEAKLPEQVKATPLAKKLAELDTVDLGAVSGTGSYGKITAADIRAAALKRVKGAEVRGDTLIPLTGMRKTVATRMKDSLNEMAQANHRITADMTEAVRLRESLKKAGHKVSYNDIVLRCTAKALTEFPMMNSSWSGGGIIQKKYVNMGVAVALDDGLIVPVIKDADLLTLPEIAACSAELAAKAKENKLAPDEYTGGTFTVSNLGMFDIDGFTAIINPPEAGIIAVGKLAKQPVIVDNEIAIRPLMQLSLTYDHRVLDGAPAAQFLRRVKELLENPGLLI